MHQNATLEPRIHLSGQGSGKSKPGKDFLDLRQFSEVGQIPAQHKSAWPPKGSSQPGFCKQAPITKTYPAIQVFHFPTK